MSNLDNDLRVQRIITELDMKLRKQREEDFEKRPVAEKVGYLLGVLLMMFLFCCFLHILSSL